MRVQGEAQVMGYAGIQRRMQVLSREEREIETELLAFMKKYRETEVTR